MSDPTTRLNAALEGRYRIERELGEGGMATVYLADDVRHGRKVAIKVLKPELAAMVGADRFLAEIRTTANLLHPHILPLYDSGEADGFLFFVSPYIDGETLRDRLDREKQLPVDEAVRIAAAVASALQAAHEQGVVHRDIKPANILLSRGEPLVADFGIALAVSESGGNRLTETGLSVGTPYYMSPEQATGDRDVEARSDVYALGCIAYEMLVGDPPYVGSTAQAVLGKILTEAPKAPAEVRPVVPKNVEGAVLKALEKLPADRFPSAEAFAKALADPSFRYGEGLAAAAGPRRSAPMLWKAATAVATAAALVLAALALRARSRPKAGPVMYFDVSLNDSLSLLTAQGVNFDVSADGSKIVFVGQDAVGSSLWVRRTDKLEPRPLPRTADARNPRFSPDGSSAAFIAGGSLQTVSLTGAPPVIVVPDSVTGSFGGGGVAWGDDGFLYFNKSDEIWRVPAGGGDPERVFSDTTKASGRSWFDALPGGRSLIFSSTNAVEPSLSTVFALDLKDGSVKSLVQGTMGRFSPPGTLLYATGEGRVVAAPFDPERVEITGAPRPLVSGIQVNSGSASYFAVSASGSLLYATGGVGAIPVATWIYPDGHQTPVPGIPSEGILGFPAISPKGGKVAFVRFGAESFGYSAGDVWIYDVAQEGASITPLTFEGGNIAPFWSPDGTEVAYRHTNPDRSMEIDARRSDFSGPPRRLVGPGFSNGGANPYRGAWTPDGRSIVYTDTKGRLVKSSLSGSGKATVVLDSLVNPFTFSLSPDGRWVAFQSDVSGTTEAWVAPMDGSGVRTRVSVSGGTFPVWTWDGKAIIYRDQRAVWTRADVRSSPDLAVVSRRALAPGADFTSSYAAAPENRILAFRRSAGSGSGVHTMRLVTDWRRGLAGGN